MTPETETDLDTHDTIADGSTESRNDVTGGGILGAVGGGIVGALAGGPIGAVIGAVVGAGASAAAVDAIEHHDHPERHEDLDEIAPATTHGGLVEPIDQVDYTVVIEPIETIYVVEESVEPVFVADLEDVIRLRAYELWEERGHVYGLAERDWLDAERELLEV